MKKGAHQVEKRDAGSTSEVGANDPRQRESKPVNYGCPSADELGEENFQLRMSIGTQGISLVQPTSFGC